MISDSVYFYYFLVHTPITVLMDATFVIPTEYQLPIQKQLSLFHIQQNKDFLAVEAPLWVSLFVIWELIFQLPFFIYAAINYKMAEQSTQREHGRCFCSMDSMQDSRVSSVLFTSTQRVASTVWQWVKQRTFSVCIPLRQSFHFTWCMISGSGLQTSCDLLNMIKKIYSFFIATYIWI